MGSAVQVVASAVDLSTLRDDPNNSRTHSDDQLTHIEALMEEFGWTNPILADMADGGQIVAGHGRKAAALRKYARGEVIHLMPGPPRGDRPGGQALPIGHGLVIDCSGWSEAQRRAYVIADNRSAELAGWDADVLRRELTALDAMSFQLDLTGFPDLDRLDDVLAGLPGGSKKRSTEGAGSLAEAFGVPPFSVLNARDGWWRDRKRAWIARGIQSELGRGRNAAYKGQDSLNAVDGRDVTGTSIFDPVLTELAYRWFSPPGGLVLDPFAGGSVRGLVASWLGRSYIGMDLSGQQLDANRQQAEDLLGDERHPVWVQGDSRQLEAGLSAAGHDQQADLIFTCPPYADLERYSEDPADLSTMAYPAFLAGYRAAIQQAVDRLRTDRFAVVVIGDVRDPKGHYRDLVGDTVQAFRDAGAELYNEAILVSPVGSLPRRAGKQFTSGRKLGKTHQNVLVFVKGGWKKATAAIGKVDFGEVEPEVEDDGA